jgi:hypothetical protein
MGAKRKSDPAAIGVLETLLSPARAKDVIDHREMIGAPMTRRAAELLILKLAEAPDPNAAADRMIEKSWRGYDVKWKGALDDGYGSFNGHARPANGAGDSRSERTMRAWGLFTDPDVEAGEGHTIDGRPPFVSRH